MVARAPNVAISGPPTRLPSVEAPTTTVACAVKAERRSRPDVDRVTRTVVAAFPAGTASPMTTAVAPITNGVGWAAIVSHPNPATTQALALTSDGRADRTAATPSTEPPSEPTA
jgi:hypothetical protein